MGGNIIMTIYLLSAFFSFVVAFFIFPHSVNITSMSLLPLCFIVVTAIEISLLKEQQKQSIDDYRLNNTAYSFREIDLNKIICSKKWLFRNKLISIPFLLLFVLYFNSGLKVLSVLLFVLTYPISRIFVIIENKKTTK